LFSFEVIVPFASASNTGDDVTWHAFGYIWTHACLLSASEFWLCAEDRVGVTISKSFRRPSSCICHQLNIARIAARM